MVHAMVNAAQFAYFPHASLIISQSEAEKTFNHFECVQFCVAP